MNATTHILPMMVIENGDFSNMVRIGDDVVLCDSIDFNINFPRQFIFREYIVVYLETGSVEGFCDGQKNKFVAPSLLFITPQQTYSFDKVTPDAKGNVLFFSRNFIEQLDILNEYQLNRAIISRQFLPLNEDECKILHDYINQMRYIVEAPRLINQPVNPFQRQAALYTTKAFFYSIGSFYFNARSIGRTSRAEELAEQLLKLVDEFGWMERRISFYADKMHLSEKYLASIVQKETGESIGRWLEKVTVKKAKYLLSETDLTIQQISTQLGFNDQSYFGAYFKRIMGISPKQYRRKQ